MICADSQKVNFLLGQQSWYTKFPCFLCLWDSRAQNQHYVNKGLPLTTELKPVDKDVIDNPLVSRDIIIFPLLLIKLGLMKHFIKVFDKEGKCFEYFVNSFTGISIERKWKLLMVQTLENLQRTCISLNQQIMLIKSLDIFQISDWEFPWR